MKRSLVEIFSLIPTMGIEHFYRQTRRVPICLSISIVRSSQLRSIRVVRLGDLVFVMLHVGRILAKFHITGTPPYAR